MKLKTLDEKIATTRTEYIIYKGNPEKTGSEYLTTIRVNMLSDLPTLRKSLKELKQFENATVCFVSYSESLKGITISAYISK